MDLPKAVSLGALFTGKAVSRWQGKPASAIAKQPVDGRVWLSSTGFASDEQADLSVHGGLEKAVHHYAAENYAFWKRELPEKAPAFAAGGFGENLSTTGLTETNICVGDVFEIGEAIVQVSQGRQPCWKLSAHIGLEDMAMRFQRSGLTGWYYRVLKEGFVRRGDRIALCERLQSDWPLSRVIAARFDTSLAPAIAARLADIPEMSQSWHKAFVRKCDTTYVEDIAPRIAGQ